MEIILGKVAFTPKGAWDDATHYALYDMTYDAFRVYISLRDDNTAPLSDRTAWRIFYEKPHADGVGIKSLEQTGESMESGGVNVWTAELTDGTRHDFHVRNGLGGGGGLRPTVKEADEEIVFG